MVESMFTSIIQVAVFEVGHSQKNLSAKTCKFSAAIISDDFRLLKTSNVDCEYLWNGTNIVTISTYALLCTYELCYIAFTNCAIIILLQCLHCTVI